MAASRTRRTFDPRLEEAQRRAEQSGRGREAARPSQISLTGWRDVLWRVAAKISADRVTLIAAGVTFYLLLSLFPALAALVSIYGLVADPMQIADHVSALAGAVPADGLELIRSQLESLAGQHDSALNFGFVFGLGIALWSANNGIKSLFEAMNVAYQETEKRGFIRLNLTALAFTLGAIVVGIGFIVLIGVLPAVLSLIPLGEWPERLMRLGRWPVLAIVVATALTLIYRCGPSRERAEWRWLTWGACFATICWLVASIGFSYYLENFANYNATYGTLGAVIGFMMWTWISVVIVIVGAEINAEMEHQTARDTTVGPDKPLGARGAEVADTLGKPSDR